MLHSTLAATHTEPMAQPHTQLQEGLCPCCQCPHNAFKYMWVLQRWPVSESDLIRVHYTGGTARGAWQGSGRSRQDRLATARSICTRRGGLHKRGRDPLLQRTGGGAPVRPPALVVVGPQRAQHSKAAVGSSPA